MNNILDMRPLRLLQYKRNDKRAGETYTLLIPKFGSSKIARWIMKKMKHPNYFLNLDEFGTMVWDLCNGEKQVREIADSLKAKYGSKVEPVHERLSVFLKVMEKKRFIAFRENLKENTASTFLRA